jgi:AraC-like DNA-binding protein
MRSKAPAHGVWFCSIPWMAIPDAMPKPVIATTVAIAYSRNHPRYATAERTTAARTIGIHAMANDRRGRLLQGSDMTLAAVARRVGYTSEFAFAKAFKRDYGVAPGSYRRAVVPRAMHAYHAISGTPAHTER